MSTHRTALCLASLIVLASVCPIASAATRRPPANLSVPSISGSAVEAGTFTASRGAWSNSPTRYAYVWKDCDSAGAHCVPVSGAGGSTYSIRHTDVGHTMRVVVTATNAYGQTSARSAPTRVIAAAPTFDTTAPTAPANLAVTGSTQTTIAATWSASTDNVKVAGYNASLDGASVGTTTTTSYTFAGLGCGTSHTLGVSAYDAAGNTSAISTVTSSASACPSATAPSNTGVPAVSGTTKVGQTLSTTNGSWSGSATISYGYQWLDCDSAGAGCTPIAGATTSSYKLAASDQGRTIRSHITASNSAGSAAASSNATGIVQAAATSTGLNGLRVAGNQVVDANGATVRLHGVNYSGTEYACIQGWGIFDGPSDSASVRAIASWHSNIVHLGLNEDCILGINGVAPGYAGANYMNAIVSYVNLLHANGLYAEVSLMWAAPGSQQALDHPAILDQDHAPAALQAIANAFKNDPNTIIGLQSEPHAITWGCWLRGGSSCAVGYTALGMQGALDAVRGAGATNVVTASGINYANDLAQWLTNKPNDPQGQLAAEAHVYGKNSCSSTSCFDTNYAPVAAQVPLIFGETGETYDASSCGSTNISTFMNWADAHSVGYEAWVWDTWGNCGSLITNFDGTPANAYAQWVHDHYLSTF